MCVVPSKALLAVAIQPALPRMSGQFDHNAEWHPTGRSATVRSRVWLASAVTHTDGTGSLSSLARIDAAEAVQTNGLGLALCSVR
jgi:hypothetical protein